ncbi:hypothetical protein EV401DRAFT_1486762 [Pisolithus croceorrhizus]|nr:hypothetical protein EV401DRAFT_1486762 [Pisolithus croceorrhizus]
MMNVETSTPHTMTTLYKAGKTRYLSAARHGQSGRRYVLSLPHQFRYISSPNDEWWSNDTVSPRSVLHIPWNVHGWLGSVARLQLGGSAAANGFQPAPLTGDLLITYPCPLGSGCAVPLEGTTTSIYRHLRGHGLIHNHRDRAPCPWPGCHREMRWGNVARHIIESHLGARLHCKFCRRSYTRVETLKMHMRVCVVGTSGMPDPGNC